MKYEVLIKWYICIYKFKSIIFTYSMYPGTEQMTSMLATYNSRKVFINHAIEFLRSRGFDGLDLDFEYPAMRGSPPGDKFKFTALCMASILHI